MMPIPCHRIAPSVEMRCSYRKTVCGARMRCFRLYAKEACPAARVLSHYSASIESFEAPSRGSAGFGYDVVRFG
jgi:hypothetical protein